MALPNMALFVSGIIRTARIMREEDERSARNGTLRFAPSADELHLAREAAERGEAYTPLPAPLRQTEGSAGYDLPSAIDITVWPGQQVLIPTGWRVALPPGTSGEIEPRSGWAMKYRIDRRAGLIDTDYRGELKVMLVNEGEQAFDIVRGTRIAQMVVRDYRTPDVLVEHDFDDTTDRGSGGFGSTGGRD